MLFINHSENRALPDSATLSKGESIATLISTRLVKELQAQFKENDQLHFVFKMLYKLDVLVSTEQGQLLEVVGSFIIDKVLEKMKPPASSAEIYTPVTLLTAPSQFKDCFRTFLFATLTSSSTTSVGMPSKVEFFVLDAFFYYVKCCK